MGRIRKSSIEVALVSGVSLTFPRLGKAGELLASGISKRLMFAERADAAGHYQYVQILHLQRCVIHTVHG